MLIGIDASRAVTQQRTGTEAYAYFLIQTLIDQSADRGHRLRLYFNQPPAPGLFRQASHVQPVIIPFPRLWTHLRLAWELHRRPPDVFFTPAHVIPLTYRGRSVATIHDLGYHYFPEAHPQRQLAYLRWSTRHNGRRASCVIADSQATRADLARLDGVDPKKVDVIYPGIDPALHPVTERELRSAVQERYGISAPYLLAIGTLQPRKNLIRLLEAHAACQAPHTLVLAGKVGWLSGPILDTVRRLREVGQAVHLPGFIDDTDKAALISGATALLLPSLYEGFGFPVLEAQACGTPVICASSSSLAEVGGEGAFYVDPMDTAAWTAAIERFISEEPLRKSLVQKGFANVRRFSWEETAEKVLNTLERAIG